MPREAPSYRDRHRRILPAPPARSRPHPRPRGPGANRRGAPRARRLRRRRHPRRPRDRAPPPRGDGARGDRDPLRLPQRPGRPRALPAPLLRPGGAPHRLLQERLLRGAGDPRVRPGEHERDGLPPRHRHADHPRGGDLPVDAQLRGRGGHGRGAPAPPARRRAVRRLRRAARLRAGGGGGAGVRLRPPPEDDRRILRRGRPPGAGRAPHLVPLLRLRVSPGPRHRVDRGPLRDPRLPLTQRAADAAEAVHRPAPARAPVARRPADDPRRVPPAERHRP